MAIYKQDIVNIDLDSGSVFRSFAKITIGTADKAANRFGIRAFRNGVECDLSGASCYGYFRDPQGNNIALTSYGTVSGNEAYVTLPQACYNYEGQFCLAIKLLVSGVTSTVRIIDGVVDNTNTGSAVAPTSAVPSYSEILSTYDQMVAAVAVANGAIATTFNAATVYPAGSYVINDGALYRITADHAANVTWANTSKVATNFGAEVTALNSKINDTRDATITDKEVTLGNTTRGYWDVQDNVASVYAQSSGSYYAFPAIAVTAGKQYRVNMYANNGHGASIILANYTNNAYSVVSSITVASSGRQTFVIDIPDTGVTHLLLTKYGSQATYVTYSVQKTDKTMLIENMAADSKTVGEKIGVINDALFYNMTSEPVFIEKGYIATDGDATTTANFNLYKFDVSNRIGEDISISTYKNQTSSSSMVMCAIYDIEYDNITRATATSEHCLLLGTEYGPSEASAISETVTVPQGAKTLLVSRGRATDGNPTLTYKESKIGGTNKKPYVSGNIFFTVDCKRPIPFGDGTHTEQATETIECVLRLPESYSPNGEPTRLVLACHGSSGYVDSENDTWYNSYWVDFMSALTNAGYAVFDANIFAEGETNVIGFALGSPLYAQVLKHAYDYIVQNYNVYPQIFAHGTSMGGVGAKTFTHFYPKLVLAQSSFAGRDICKYLNQINTTAWTLPYSGRLSAAYGYADDAALIADKFSHCVGMSDSLGIMKISNGAVVLPPNRETNFADWIAYYAELNDQSENADLTKWIGNSEVPYKAWNAWNDEEESTAQEVLMANAYSKTNSAPYYAVSYTLTDEEIGALSAHAKMSYGMVRDMRDQLVAWYKRWE